MRFKDIVLTVLECLKFIATILAGIIAFLVIMFVVGFIVISVDDRISWYKNHEWVKTDNHWQQKFFYFCVLPNNQIAKVGIEENLLNQNRAMFYGLGKTPYPVRISPDYGQTLTLSTPWWDKGNVYRYFHVNFRDMTCSVSIIRGHDYPTKPKNKILDTKGQLCESTDFDDKENLCLEEVKYRQKHPNAR